MNVQKKANSCEGNVSGNFNFDILLPVVSVTINSYLATPYFWTGAFSWTTHYLSRKLKGTESVPFSESQAYIPVFNTLSGYTPDIALLHDISNQLAQQPERFPVSRLCQPDSALFLTPPSLSPFLFLQKVVSTVQLQILRIFWIHLLEQAIERADAQAKQELLKQIVELCFKLDKNADFVRVWKLAHLIEKEYIEKIYFSFQSHFELEKFIDTLQNIILEFLSAKAEYTLQKKFEEIYNLAMPLASVFSALLENSSGGLVSKTPDSYSARTLNKTQLWVMNLLLLVDYSWLTIADFLSAWRASQLETVSQLWTEIIENDLVIIQKLHTEVIENLPQHITPEWLESSWKSRDNFAQI